MRGPMIYALALASLLCVGCENYIFSKNKGPKIDPYEAVKVGMTEKQVVALMGAPAKRQMVSGAEGGGTQFVYRWLATHNMYIVVFEDGVVLGKRKT